MKKTFDGWLFNRIETLGNKEYNHVGCKGKDEKFIDFLTQFVPEVGTQRKVKFTVETQEDIEKEHSSWAFLAGVALALLIVITKII